MTARKGAGLEAATDLEAQKNVGTSRRLIGILRR